MSVGQRLEVGPVPVRVGVLVSGGGSNLQAILDACHDGELRGLAEVVLVISSRAGVYALQRAEAAGVPARTMAQQSYANRLEQQLTMAAELQAASVRLVVCVGFDRILTAAAIRAMPQPILNLHPSLLPAFGGGLHAIRDALEYGVKITGCTVHLVGADYGVDAGPIIAQEAVPVAEGDDEATLAGRVHAAEHRTVVRAIRLVCEGGLRVDGRRVHATSLGGSKL